MSINKNSTAYVHRKKRRNIIHSIINGDYDRALRELKYENKVSFSIRNEGDPYMYEGEVITKDEYEKLVEKGIIKAFTLEFV